MLRSDNSGPGHGDPTARRGARAAGADEAIDSLLRRLGIWRFQLPMPFADVSVVNTWAIAEHGGGVTLVDTGVDDPAAAEARAHALASIGLSHADVRRVVVTHGHADHYGAAQSIAEAGGRAPAPILAHPADYDPADPTGSRCSDHVEHFTALLARHGTPGDVVEGWVAARPRADRLVRPIASLTPVGDGDVLHFRHFDARVFHLPGHTRGLVGLFDEVNGVLISGDHLIKGIAPGLRFDPGPEFSPLVAYTASLHRTRELDVRVVLPGHGRPFDGPRQEIDGLLRRLEERQRRILGALADRPHTAWAVADALAREIAPSAVKDVVCSTVAHLDVLERGGAVARDDAGRLTTFRLAR